MQRGDFFPTERVGADGVWFDNHGMIDPGAREEELDRALAQASSRRERGESVKGYAAPNAFTIRGAID